MNLALIVGWWVGFLGMVVLFVAAGKRRPPPRRWMWAIVPIVAALWPAVCIVGMMIHVVELVTEPSEEK